MLSLFINTRFVLYVVHHKWSCFVTSNYLAENHSYVSKDLHSTHHERGLRFYILHFRHDLILKKFMVADETFCRRYTKLKHMLYVYLKNQYQVILGISVLHLSVLDLCNNRRLVFHSADYDFAKHIVLNNFINWSKRLVSARRV